MVNQMTLHMTTEKDISATRIKASTKIGSLAHAIATKDLDIRKLITRNQKLILRNTLKISKLKIIKKN